MVLFEPTNIEYLLEFKTYFGWIGHGNKKKVVVKLDPLSRFTRLKVTYLEVCAPNSHEEFMMAEVFMPTMTDGLTCIRGP